MIQKTCRINVTIKRLLTAVHDYPNAKTSQVRSAKGVYRQALSPPTATKLMQPYSLSRKTAIMSHLSKTKATRTPSPQRTAE